MRRGGSRSILRSGLGPEGKGSDSDWDEIGERYAELIRDARGPDWDSVDQRGRTVQRNG